MGAKRSTARLISLDDARKAKKDEFRAPETKNSFLESWLKGYEDGQALVRENQQLRAMQEQLKISAQEYSLYLASILAYVAIMVAWALQLK